MHESIYENIILFMSDQRKYYGKTFFSTREISEFFGLSIYNARHYLRKLQSQKLVVSGRAGKGQHIRWRLT
ncbi:UNVERIFIED_ORG: FaeA-like protein [Citrobacter freundii]